jgi:hypothetical protein
VGLWIEIFPGFLFWSLIPFPTAVLRRSIWVLGSPYTRAVCFQAIIATFAQGSNTIFGTVRPGVFSWWLYVCARLAGGPDVFLGILRCRVGLETYCLVAQVGMRNA